MRLEDSSRIASLLEARRPHASPPSGAGSQRPHGASESPQYSSIRRPWHAAFTTPAPSSKTCVPAPGATTAPYGVPSAPKPGDTLSQPLGVSRAQADPALDDSESDPQ